MKRPGVTSHGTARDLAEKGDGYAANGLSEHSRHSAHSQNIKLPGYIERGPKVRGPRSGGELVGENVKALAKLERDARCETNPVRLAKLKKNIEIKKRFIEKLGGNVGKQITGGSLPCPNGSFMRSAARTGRVVEVSDDQHHGFIRDDETGARIYFPISAARGELVGRGDIVDYVAPDRKALRVWMNVKLLAGEFET
ncbi:MAG: hypothetical protein JWO19_6118 [Bryobacterales bacterium]|nr:hypothetical protein [Bryobacterales bacterium]